MKALAILVLASAPAAADTVEARAHLGVVTAPFDAPALSQAEGQAAVIVLDGTHALSAATVAVRVPLVLASVAQPAGSYVDAAALGNPQLRVIVPYRGVSLGLDVGIPIAGHAPDLMANRAVALANAVEGFASPELFTAGVAPITPFARLDRTRLGAELRMPLLVRVSDADLPGATNAVGVSLIASLEGRRPLSRRLGVAVTSTLAVELAPAVEHARSVSRVQDLERASLHIRLGERSALDVDLQLAFVGPLGGSCFGGGVRAVVRL